MALTSAGCGADVDSDPDARCFGCGEWVEVVRPGVINLFGDREHIFRAPSRVIAGVPATIEVRTHGGGCTVAAASMAVGWKRDELVLSPYDLRLENEDGVCTSDYYMLLHTTVQTFRDPGTVNVRVRGRVRGALGLDAPKSYVYPILVLEAEPPGPQPGPTVPTGPFPWTP